MKYKESEVLDIIKSLTDQDPEKVLNDWANKKGNILLDLTENSYNNFIYTFPLKKEDKLIANITLTSLYGWGQDVKDHLMLKYFGKEEYDKSFHTYSHDTYLDNYFRIFSGFTLPKIVDGLFGEVFEIEDAEGKKFEVRVSAGYPTNESDEYIWHKWVDSNTTYRFDNGVSIKINTKDMQGWSLGEKINESIKTRTRDNKINSVIKND
jgi:hypothetical protein